MKTYKQALNLARKRRFDFEADQEKENTLISLMKKAKRNFLRHGESYATAQSDQTYTLIKNL